MIVLDGYTARGTDYELVHFNGQLIKYRNFIYEEPFNGYPFFTAYGHGLIWSRLSRVDCIIGIRSMNNLRRDSIEPRKAMMSIRVMKQILGHFHLIYLQS